MTKKLLTTSVLSACLATTILASGVAFAKPDDVYFYPKSKWKVEQVSAGTDNALKVCSLSNQFNNGYIIQIAGNSNGFTNLNIDFRQNSFKTNRKYEVKYSVPGVIEKLIPTKAFKKNLLVSDFRGEKEFAAALQAASVLDVNVRGVEFRMYMTGFDKAMADYSECVKPPISSIMASIEEDNVALEDFSPADTSGGFMPMPNNDIVAVPPPPVMQQQEDVAYNQGGDLPSDITMPANKLRPKPSPRPRYTEKLAQQLKDESNKYKSDAQQTKPINMVQPQSSASIEPEASAVQVIADDKLANIDATPPVVKPVVTNIRSPKPIIHVTKHDPISIDLTKIEPASGTSDGDLGMASSDVMTNDSISNIAVSAETLSNIEPTVGQSNDGFIDMRNKVSELEGQIGVLSNKNKMLNEELKIVLQDSEKEKMSVSSQNWDLERATMKFNESERQVHRLGRKLQTYRAQCQQEKTELESMLFDPSLTNQNQLAKLSSLEEELDTAKADFYRQQRQYEERIRLLEGRLDAL